MPSPLRYLDDRLGVVSAFRETMSEKRPPQGIGFLRTIGFAAFIVAGIQLASGLAVAMHYVPSTALAYDSIRALEQDVVWGAFVRSLHHYGASAFVVLAALHMARVFFTGAYKAPREFTWLTGLGLFGIVLAFGFTGYLLPWDQKAYFATKVGTEIAGKAPFIGDAVQQSLQGGDVVGGATLTRFYVIHVVLLPLALVGLLGLHFAQIQRHGVTPPGRPVGDPGVKGPTYFPFHTAREALVGVVVAGALFALAAAVPAPLEAIAEPSETGYEPRPDWYFAGAFELLKWFQGPLESLGTFWIPTLLGAALALLPFVDKNPSRKLGERRFVTAAGVLVAVFAIGLTVQGILDRPHNTPVPVYELGADATEVRGYFTLRRGRCLECHECGGFASATNGEVDVFGQEEYGAPMLHEAVADYDLESFDALLLNPEDEIGTEDMPSFDYLDAEDRRALWIFLRTLSEPDSPTPK